jgi:hypothetical protein
VTRLAQHHDAPSRSAKAPLAELPCPPSPDRAQLMDSHIRATPEDCRHPIRFTRRGGPPLRRSADPARAAYHASNRCDNYRCPPVSCTKSFRLRRMRTDTPTADRWQTDATVARFSLFARSTTSVTSESHPRAPSPRHTCRCTPQAPLAPVETQPPKVAIPPPDGVVS